MWERSDAYVTGYKVPLEKYRFAIRHLGAPKFIADAACGLGYGSDMLTKAGHRVVGIDVTLEALNYAVSHAYQGAFLLADISRQTFDGFEALVSIETLEHLIDPLAWLKNLRVQELVISTTCWEGSMAHDEWHKHNFTMDQFRDMLRPKFEILDELVHVKKQEQYLTIYARNLVNETSKPAKVKSVQHVPV